MFNDFRRKMTNKMFFEETKPGVFERNKNFHIKNNRWVDAQYNEIDNFCFNLRDGILNIFEKYLLEVKQNLSKMNFPNFKKSGN